MRFSLARYKEAITKLVRRRGYYYLRYYADGVLREKSTGTKMVREAREFQLEFMKNLPSSMTFSKYFCDFFHPDKCPWRKFRVANGGSVSDQYLANRRGYLRNHIMPQFGDRYIDHIKPSEIQRWLLAIESSLQTRKHIYNTMKDMFAYALMDGVIETSPMNAVIPPVVSNRDSRNAFTMEEFARLVEVAPQVSPKAQLTIWTLGSTGLRSGELRALTSSSVLPEKAIWVTKAMKGNKISTPKTEKSFRVVPITDNLYAALCAHIENNDLGPDDLLFPTSKESITRWVHLAKKLANIEREGLTAHSLRHTYVSFLRGTINESVLRLITGHTSDTSTNRYDQKWVQNTLQQVMPIKEVLTGLDVVNLSK